MRKIIPILTLAFLAAGCYKEIRIPTEDKDPVLVMNAQMDNLEETHVVNLSRSLLSKVEPFPGAQVKVYVNGSLVAQACYMEQMDAFSKLFEDEEFYKRVMGEMAKAMYYDFQLKENEKKDENQ